jgi:hypothetical protein
MPDQIEIEGAADYVFGRPRDDGNPYSHAYAYTAWLAWRRGWEAAHELVPTENVVGELMDTWARWPLEERWRP